MNTNKPVKRKLKESVLKGKKSKTLLKIKKDKSFGCTECNFYFKTLNAYIVHIVKVHSNESFKQIRSISNMCHYYGENTSINIYGTDNWQLYNVTWNESNEQDQVDFCYVPEVYDPGHELDRENYSTEKEVGPIQIRKFSKELTSTACKISSSCSSNIYDVIKCSKSTLVKSIEFSQKSVIKKGLSQETSEINSVTEKNLPDIVCSNSVSLNAIEKKDNVTCSKIISSSAFPVTKYNGLEVACLPLQFDKNDVNNQTATSNAFISNNILNQAKSSDADASVNSPPTQHVDVLKNVKQVQREPSSIPAPMSDSSYSSHTLEPQEPRPSSHTLPKKKKNLARKSIRNPARSRFTNISSPDSVCPAQSDSARKAKDDVKALAVATCSKSVGPGSSQINYVVEKTFKQESDSLCLVDVAPKPMKTLLNSGLVTLPFSNSPSQIMAMSESARTLLDKSFLSFPYPRAQKLRELSKATGLSTCEVKSWFAMNRLRFGVSWDPDEVNDAWQYLRDCDEDGDD